MSIARERIVPRIEGSMGWVWLRFAAIGVALGAPVGATVPVLVRGLSDDAMYAGTTGAAVRIGLAIALVVFSVMPLPWLLRVTQRWGAVVGFQFGYCVAALAAAHARLVLSLPDGGADPAEWLEWTRVRELAMLAGGCLVAAIILRPAFRWFLVRTSEHRAGDCAWCGYTRGAEGISICPECGRPAAPARFRFHRHVTSVVWLSRRSGQALAVSLGILLIAALGPLWKRTIPFARFYASMPGGIPVALGWQAGPYGSRLQSSSVQVWMREFPGSMRGLYVSRIDDMLKPRAERSTIIVSVGGVPEEAAGVRWGTYGTPLVTTTLGHRESDWVTAHGLPPELARAMYAMADEHRRDVNLYDPGRYQVATKPQWFPP